MVLTRIRDGLSSKLAFFPPTPPSYKIETHGDGRREPYIEPTDKIHYKKVPRAEIAEIPITNGRGKGETIVTAYIKAPTPVRFTLLHSHGNAVDLGQMLGFYEQLARLLHCNVFAYDFRGYGQSSGTPAASACLVDVSTALKYLMEKYNKELKDIVLYGQSIGSGPTSYLASVTPGLAGVILHSAFMSGLRVLKPNLTKFWPSSFDIFVNIKYVPKISCRTLIMHVSCWIYGKEIMGFII
jgi:pimeloyl-ACP methyl ester carboxylesterase